MSPHRKRTGTVKQAPKDDNQLPAFVEAVTTAWVGTKTKKEDSRLKNTAVNDEVASEVENTVEAVESTVKIAEETVGKPVGINFNLDFTKIDHALDNIKIF